MRQLSITLLLIFLSLIGFEAPSYSAIKGGVNYSIPIDYSKLSETELTLKAEKYFHEAKKLPDEEIDENMTNALMLYTILQKMDNDNIEYCVRLGILYDKLDKDRYAKGNFSRAISINHARPEPYFYFGEFYYRRESYGKALKYYKKAYARGYENDYTLLCRLGDIYEKFGDSRAALNYLTLAYEQNPTEELATQIQRLKNFDATNKEFYSDSRIQSKELYD